jgi:hypothetical protein
MGIQNIYCYCIDLSTKGNHFSVQSRDSASLIVASLSSSNLSSAATIILGDLVAHKVLALALEMRVVPSSDW